MAKRKTKTSSIEDQLANAIASGWCVVDTDNKFTFNSDDYLIDVNVKQYRVMNKASKVDGQLKSFTNDSLMSSILVIDNGDELKFFDENFKEVSSNLVRLM